MGQFLIGQGSEGRPFSIDPSSLTKHSIVFGATGSGKTVLCKNIIESASISGIPVLAIDPKGDIGCLAIRSLDFSFRPFSDIEAKLLGQSPEKCPKGDIGFLAIRSLDFSFRCFSDIEPFGFGTVYSKRQSVWPQ